MRFPAELQSLVLEQLWDRSGRTIIAELASARSYIRCLRALSRAARSWTHDAQRALRQLVVLTNTPALGARLGALAASPLVGGAIETVLYDWRDEYRAAADPAIDEFVAVVRTWPVREWIGGWPGRASEVAGPALDALVSTLVRAHVWHLEDMPHIPVGIREIIFDAWEPLEEIVSLAVPHHGLQCLSLDVALFTGDDVSEYLLPLVDSSFPALNRLTLISIYVEELDVFLGAAELPSLRHLRVDLWSAVKADVDGAAESSARVAAEMARLLATRLTSCTLGTALLDGTGVEAIRSARHFLTFGNEFARACRATLTTDRAATVHLRPARIVCNALAARFSSLVSMFERAGACCTFKAGAMRASEDRAHSRRAMDPYVRQSAAGRSGAIGLSGEAGRSASDLDDASYISPAQLSFSG